MIATTEARAEELYGLVRGCTLCPLASTRTMAVPGEGPLDAEVMCIGEAPGVNEDKQGRPFVGAAGQFLGELLGAAGLQREDVYICNVLKCRPPGNRDPMPNEIDTCAEYLDLQIDMVDPLVIVTLGRFSMAKWFPQQAISRIHGSIKEVDGRVIVPMYHPAAALHQGNLRQVLLNDFAKLPAILQEARRKREQGTGNGEQDLRSRGALPPHGPATPPSAAPEPDARWGEPAFAADTEVEFDPGDAHVSPSPANEGSRERGSGGEGREPPTTGQADAQLPPPAAPGDGTGVKTEPTAEEPAPAEQPKQQLSLFE